MTMLLGILLILVSTTAYTGSVLLWAGASRSRAERAGIGLLLVVIGRMSGLLGVALGVLAWGFEVLALTRLSLTLARILGAAGLGALFIGARWLLGERLGRREAIGIAAIGIGLAAVAIVPPTSSSALPNADHWLLLALVLTPLSLTPLLLRRARRYPSAAVYALSAGAAYALSALGTKGVADWLVARHALLALALPLCGVVVGALLGFMNELSALQRGKVVAVVPLVLAVQTFVPIVCAPLFFAESWPSGAWSEGMLLAGVSVSLGGVVLIARSSAHVLRHAPDVGRLGA